MKVAVVHSFYDRAQASGENEVVLAQIEQLRSRGETVELIAQYTDVEKASRLYPLRAVRGAANLGGPSPEAQLEAFQPDVVHVHNLFPNWDTKWLATWGRRTVVTLHNYRPLCSNALMWRDGHDCNECLVRGTRAAVEHACYRDSRLATAPLAFASRDRGAHQPVLQQTARIITLNSGAAQLFQGLTSTPVVVIPNFTAGQEQVPGSQGTSGRWLFVGRLTPEKGVARLISQLQEGVGLDVVGDGPDRAAVESAASASRADIRLLGKRDHVEVLAMMQQAEGLVIPSLWSEGIPTTALEALSCGTPLVVASPVASAPDLTAEGAGVIYDPEDPGAVGVALATVSAARSEASAAARNLHARRFSADAWTAATLALYQDVIAELEPDEEGGGDMGTVDQPTAAAARSAAAQWTFPWGEEPLHEVIREDLKANPRDPGSWVLMGNLRLSQYLIGRLGRRNPLALASVVMARAVNEGILGVELRPATKVAPGLSVYHRFGLVSNNSAVIGRHVQLRHGVTIGHKVPGEPSPVICDDVEVGAGAIIVGDIIVGRGAKIAAGAVVVKDVPPGAVVAGNPAKIIGYTDQSA